ETGRVAADGIAILCTAIQLKLLLIEAVHDVTSAAAGSRAGRILGDAVRGEDIAGRASRVGRGDEAVDAEGLVGEMRGEALALREDLVMAGGGERRGRGEVHIVLQQDFEGLAVLPELPGLCGRRLGQPIDRLAADRAPPAEEIIEAVILLID